MYVIERVYMQDSQPQLNHNNHMRVKYTMWAGNRKQAWNLQLVV